MAAGRDRAGCHRQFPVEEDRVGDAAHVPQLQEDAAAGGVHGVGDVLPASHLFFRPDARGVGIAHALRAHGRGFAQDQAR